MRMDVHFIMLSQILVWAVGMVVYDVDRLYLS